MSYEEEMLAMLLNESEAALMQDRELELAYLKGAASPAFPIEKPNPYIQEVIEKLREEALNEYGVGGTDGTAETPGSDESVGKSTDAGSRQPEASDLSQQVGQGTGTS
jgi:hypothetical protein